MFDMHNEIYSFYTQHVNLRPTDKIRLEEYKDKNIIRLKKGLKNLGYSEPIRTPTQGGQSMGTSTQLPENIADVDHDIDVAVVFKRGDLPENPLDARKRVLAGILEGGGNFKKDPEARTNAITIWYQENYHVDMPVHRVFKDSFGREIIEHAGVSWTPRDPTAITRWFTDEVSRCSPCKKHGATVAEQQMRRIVQFLKYFSKVQAKANLPGGLLISVLVSECYVPDNYRDDRALYETINAIYHRLQSYNLHIYNPVHNSLKLTYKDEYINQVSRFKTKLGEIIEWVSPLFKGGCSREDALKAWNTVFKHTYWSGLIDEIEEAKAIGEARMEAKRAGSLYTSQSGRIHIKQPTDGRFTKIPNTRYYGQEE